MVADGSRSSCGFYHVLPHSRAGTMWNEANDVRKCEDISTRWNSGNTTKREWTNQNDSDFFSAHMWWIEYNGLTTLVYIGLGLFLAPSLECRASGIGTSWNRFFNLKLIQAVFHLVVEAMWRAWLELEGVGVRQSWTEASLSWFRSFIARRARKGENFHKGMPHP